MLERVHHIDFVVRDLDAAADRFQRILARRPLSRESLPDRGVDLVRFDLGGIWLVLVQPTREDSPVQTFVDEYGEGFFHMAFKTDDVAAEASRLEGEGVRLVNRQPRRGVEGWKLVDLAMDDVLPVYLQLAEEDDA